MEIGNVCPPYDHGEMIAPAAETLGLELIYILPANRKEGQIQENNLTILVKIKTI